MNGWLRQSQWLESCRQIRAKGLQWITRSDLVAAVFVRPMWQGGRVVIKHAVESAHLAMMGRH